MEPEKSIQKELISNPSTTQAYLIDKVNNFYAVSVKNFETKWKKYTNDKEVLSTVSELPINFHSDDFAQNYREVELKFSSKEKQFISNKIKNLLKKGVIKESQHEDGEFIFPIFLVPKTENEFSWVLNL